MKIVVFAGPTLGADEIRKEIDAEVLPPVAQGDVLRAARNNPRAIGIIDGFFDRVPAVWHKEILWAISRRIPVFGAASMGALRAVELAPYGMFGVGKIFSAFHSGVIEDDDEVAVAHAAADQGFRALSEALVNIRATLQAAVDEQVIGQPTSDGLIRVAKALHYPERTYPRLLAGGSSSDLDANELGALEGWLPHGAVNQKRLDALDMVFAMREMLRGGPLRLPVEFTFEHTEAWEAACVRDVNTTRPLHGPVANELLEEIQVSGEYADVANAALARALSLRLAPGIGGRADQRAAADARATLCRELGLRDGQALNGWLQGLDLAPDEVEGFFEDAADVRRIRQLFESEILRQIPDVLRERGLYANYALRAQGKRSLFEGAANEPLDAHEIGLSEAELWAHYFSDVLERDVPADLERFAGAQGFPDLESLRRAAIRELYARSRLSVLEAAKPPRKPVPKHS